MRGPQRACLEAGTRLQEGSLPLPSLPTSTALPSPGPHGARSLSSHLFTILHVEGCAKLAVYLHWSSVMHPSWVGARGVGEQRHFSSGG